MANFFKKISYTIAQRIWSTKYPELELPEMPESAMRQTALIADRYELLRRLKQGSRGAELGVNKGVYSQAILEIVQPELLHLVDTWTDKQIYQHCQELFDGQEQVKMHKTYSLQFLKEQEADSLDWVYIDTDHSYKTTLEELNESARVVKSDGLICGHDYTLISSKGILRYGVVPAVNQFCKEQGYQLAFLTHEAHRHLSFALKKTT